MAGVVNNAPPKFQHVKYQYLAVWCGKCGLTMDIFRSTDLLLSARKYDVYIYGERKFFTFILVWHK